MKTAERGITLKKLYSGKTKDVYDLGDGRYLLEFKDSATFGADGKPDPGANQVGGTIEGLGQASLRLSKYFFEKLNAAGLFTHYIDSDLEAGTMTVRPAALFGGKAGLEVICRLRATGSFIRRYGNYCVEGQELDHFVEVSLKDDGRGDPMISREALDMLNILTPAEYDDLAARAKQATAIISEDLSAKGLTLYDIKFEFGRIDGKVALIDEFSWGIMRVYKDDKWLQPFELLEYYRAFL